MYSKSHYNGVKFSFWVSILYNYLDKSKTTAFKPNHLVNAVE